MEIVIAAVLLGLVPMAEKLIKIAGDRSRTRGVAEVIHASASADLARAYGAAEVMRARAALSSGCGSCRPAGEKGRTRV
ncbi:hypothetical protein AMK27_38390 [Streptomyces sp. CB02009]|uniref:hypothetical protein n=1 Tax=Streptomyces sp. CB02009 TaxID=1703938 RepID=UPI00093DF450|nr:hypothetical protein [Streptomyces sp. CB02009]OKJ48639.1 hypothetical protein AMK27_38390 [Streptomyces sp. CB02009]